MSRNNKEEEKGTRIPEENASKAMDSKKDVERSPDERTDEDFPGYPHYPAKEDIMDQRTDSHRVDVDVENLPSNRNASGVSQRFASGRNEPKGEMPGQPASEEGDLGIQMGTEADVTDDDLAILNSDSSEIGTPQHVSNEDLNDDGETDLDVPGSELDDENESIGEEDEENNYYSLGGDRQESNEEDPYSGPDRGQS